MIFFLKKKLSTETKDRLRKIRRTIVTPFVSSNLTLLSKIHESDKGTTHNYTKYYDFYFRSLRKQKLKILEIGVGGYDNPKIGGGSLRMWKAYFPNSEIVSFDMYDKTALNEHRIKIYQGNQSDEKFLTTLAKKEGPFDIIIDDGSHINSLNNFCFEKLFPYLKMNGYYVIEDVQTSYWEEFEGSSTDLEKPDTTINYFKSLLHGINHAEIKKGKYQSGKFDLELEGIMFFHNIIFILKGDNSIKSNALERGSDLDLVYNPKSLR